MKTVYVASALLVACAYFVTYSEACCKKELIVGLSGLGCLGHGHSYHAPSHCGCGCDCELCLPVSHHSSCGCDHCSHSSCGCGCGGLNVCLTKKLKKKNKTIIKEYC